MFNLKRIRELEDEVEFLIEEIAFAEGGIDDAFCAIGALLDRVEALEGKKTVKTVTTKKK